MDESDGSKYYMCLWFEDFMIQMVFPLIFYYVPEVFHTAEW